MVFNKRIFLSVQKIERKISWMYMVFAFVLFKFVKGNFLSRNKRKGISEIILVIGFLLIFALSLVTLVYILFEGKDAFAHVLHNLHSIVKS